MKKWGKILLTLLIIFMTAGCGNTQQNDNNKLQIATTATALQYFVEAIGGDYVEVIYSLTGSPHHFELTPSDATAITKAALFINADAGDYTSIGEQIKAVNNNMTAIDVTEGIELLASNEDHDHDDHGDHEEELEIHGMAAYYRAGDLLSVHLHGEGTTFKWYIKRVGDTDYQEIANLASDTKELEYIVSDQDNDASIIVRSADGVHESDPVTLHLAKEGVEITTESLEMKEGLDPHVWLDPVHAQTVVQTIITALSTADSVHATTYKANGEALIKKLQALDESFNTTLENVKNPYILVGHAAYGYLAHRYELTEVSINSNADHSENTQLHMIELDDLIKEHNIKYIFLEENVEPNSSVAVLVNEHHLITSYLYNIETPVTVATDYFELMHKNLAALEQATQ